MGLGAASSRSLKIPLILAAVLVIAVPAVVVGFYAMERQTGPSTIDVTSVSVSLLPSANGTSAPNGTGSLATGGCMTPTNWYGGQNLSTTGSASFATSSVVTCIFAYNYSSWYHPGNHTASSYEIKLVSANVSAPFTFLGPSAPTGGQAPTNQSSEFVGLDFRVPATPGDYVATFSVYYSWSYV
jgi:hypothetical protein